MTSTEDTVGFGEKQIDPWCKAKWDLIELIDSDKEILREVFTLSASKISLPDQMKNGEKFLDALENYYEHEIDDIVEYLNCLANKLQLHVNEGSTSVTSILERYNCQRREHIHRQKQLDCELVGREQETRREKEEIDKVKSFYLDFEAGKFDNKVTENEFIDAESVSSERMQVEKESMNSDSLDSSSLLSYSSSLRVTSEDEEEKPAEDSNNEPWT